MLLHNQTNKQLHWEADGVGYDWPPHGSCEVPDKWRVNLRDQGFPVDVTPMPPQQRAELVAKEEREALAKSELVKLQAKLADAEARVAAATKEVEAAHSREEKALEQLADAEAKNATLEEQLRLAKSDVSEHEKLLGDEMKKREAAEKKAQTKKARDQVDESSQK